MRVTKQEQQEAKQTLREIIKPGDTIYTVLRHVSSSGMTRDIDVYAIKDNEPRCISRLTAKATGFRYNDKVGAVRVGGCGMDMGFHIVYSLSRVLFDGEFHCVGKHCPSNDHFNGDKDYSPHKHSDGGYALKQRWM